MRCYTDKDIKEIRASFDVDITYKRLYENNLKHKEMIFNSKYSQHRELVTQEEIDELKQILL